MSEDVQEIVRRLEALEAQVQALRARIDQLRTPRVESPITTEDLLQLPDSLRKTMLAITHLKEATAEAVANETRRTRGMESIYLNQLVRMGHLEKIRRGRKIFFRTLRMI